MKPKIVIATIRDWNIRLAKQFKKKHKNVLIITSAKKLKSSVIKKFNPQFIFFPHWSWIIPEEIYKNYECVVFHETDLPYGRGGSPIQNLIVRGKTKTKISAIRVVKKLDAGPVYFKRPLSLEGTALEIFERSSKTIFNEMIPKIMKKKVTPKAQKGKAVVFKRRKPQDSDIKNLKSVKDVYNYIRMLDAPGYPPAYVETKKLKYTFSKAKLRGKKLSAKVNIEVKK